MVSYIDYMNIYTYLLFLCLGAMTDTPVTPPCILKHDWPITGKTKGSCLPWKTIPLQRPPSGTTRALNFFRRLKWLVYPPNRIIILQELGGLWIRCRFNGHHPVSSYTQLTKHEPHRLLELTWWLILVRLGKVKLPPTFGVNSFVEKLHCE